MWVNFVTKSNKRLATIITVGGTYAVTHYSLLRAKANADIVKETQAKER
jgi:hypothetical protein